jgi:hypothetical protein
MNKLTLLSLMLVLASQLFAQYTMQNIDESKCESVYYNNPPSEIKKLEMKNMVLKDDVGEWMTTVATKALHVEHEVPDAELFEQIKREKNKQKAENRNRQIGSQANYRANFPLLFENFESNLPLQGTPPDNTLAISNDGIIVSAINSNIYYFDTEGNTLFNATFSDFYNDADLTGKLYDPRVIYDSQADRFIFVALHGSHSSNNKVLISFSKSNNPMDGWYIYYLPILSIHSTYTSKWLDYPEIGISSEELFITGNIFINSDGGFSESIIIQIDKNKGYHGKNLDWLTWNNVRDGNGDRAFTICPVSWGHQGNYGPGLYFVSTTTHGQSSQIQLYKISNTINNNPELKSYTLSSTLYNLAGDAIQKNTNPNTSPGLLDIGDCRVQNGFYQISNGKGIIHFVFHSEYNNAYNGINYQRIDLSNMSVSNKLFGVNNMDFAYPSVVSSAPNASHEKDVMIAFLASSEDHYPEIRVVHCDDNMNFSGSLVIKEGEAYIDILEGVERWGDYSGITRKHNTSAPRIWISGCYGGNIRDNSTFPPVINNNVYRTYIAEVADNGTTSMEEDVSAISVNVYPNPVSEYVFVEFTLSSKQFISIDIYDLQARHIKNLYKDLTKSGSTKLQFNKLALPEGQFIIKVTNGKNIITSKHIVVH